MLRQQAHRLDAEIPRDVEDADSDHRALRRERVKYTNG
jgi:hypothetical protein